MPNVPFNPPIPHNHSVEELDMAGPAKKSGRNGFKSGRNGLKSGRKAVLFPGSKWIQSKWGVILAKKGRK